MKVLGIESSPATKPALLPCMTPILAARRACSAHAVYSQIALHAEYGGVVPELASRDHVRNCCR